MFFLERIKHFLKNEMVNIKLVMELIQDKIPEEYVKRDWHWHFILGFFFILAGTIGLLAIPFVPLSTIYLFACFMIIGGSLQFMEAINANEKRQSKILHIIGGVLYTFGGFLCLLNPVAASLPLLFLLCVMIAAIGLCRAVAAVVHKSDITDWKTVLASGLESVGIAFLIGLSWPYSSLWILGLFLSVDLILNGWGNVVIAFESGKEFKEVEPPASPSEPGLAVA